MTAANAATPSAARLDVAVLQLSAAPGEVTANVDRVVQDVRFHGLGCDLVVAPELVTSGYDLDLLAEHGLDLAEPADGTSVRRMSTAAVAAGVTLVAGFLERDGDLIYDSAMIAGPGGDVRVYRKTHLYPPELAVFAAGDVLETVSTPRAELGTLLCFEHAFPEIATTLALAGAQLLVIPSAVPVGYEHLLELRTRARAQDNQIYAVACNMSGNGFCGRSLVSGPRGEVLAAAGEDETVLRARLDLGAVARERSTEPALSLRRPELYGSRERR